MTDEIEITMSQRQPVSLTVVAPTYNESENIAPLIAELERSLGGVDYEILISDDDSPDRTWARVEEIGARNPRVRVLRRMANRGLGPAVIDAFSEARGDAVACIDADLQHDPSILPQMLKALGEGSDLVVGSRYVNGGGTSNWSWPRRFVSWTATKLSEWFLGLQLRDPMSGYFMLRRDDFLRVRSSLSPHGFKILLEIAAVLKPRRLQEVPYTFRARTAGKSKLSSKVIFAYLTQLWRLSRRDCSQAATQPSKSKAKPA